MMFDSSIVVRGFSCGHLVFADRIELHARVTQEGFSLGPVGLTEIVNQHLAKLDLSLPHMIEIEFVGEEEDPNERYFRFGNDPSMMVLPLPIVVD